jgi:hypothetical protein
MAPVFATPATAKPPQHCHAAFHACNFPLSLQLTWSWQRSNSGVREMMRVTPLLQQQDTSSTTRLIMTHIMASYTAMKVSDRRAVQDVLQ